MLNSSQSNFVATWSKFFLDIFYVLSLLLPGLYFLFFFILSIYIPSDYFKILNFISSSSFAVTLKTISLFEVM